MTEGNMFCKSGPWFAEAWAPAKRNSGQRYMLRSEGRGSTQIVSC